MMIEIDSEVDTSDITRQVANAYEMVRDNYAGLLEFILDIDENICDLQFTIALRDRLNEIIRAELGDR